MCPMTRFLTVQSIAQLHVCRIPAERSCCGGGRYVACSVRSGRSVSDVSPVLVSSLIASLRRLDVSVALQSPHLMTAAHCDVEESILIQVTLLLLSDTLIAVGIPTERL